MVHKGVKYWNPSTAPFGQAKPMSEIYLLWIEFWKLVCFASLLYNDYVKVAK